MHFSRANMAFTNANGIPLVRVTIVRNRYVYSHPVTGEKLATSPVTDDGIKWFASKFWHIPAIEIR